ncbi:C-type lectin domain family 4 member D [Aplysia californica]|uniref:C-type lectin domain family 4 member D n=1 Tax=Aplysia californica TaxID=6500 RepID=A0ABM1ADV1_APLCA|nr:C-type lectin domain family 4 member D [Aplysia californica]
MRLFVVIFCLLVASGSATQTLLGTVNATEFTFHQLKDLMYTQFTPLYWNYLLSTFYATSNDARLLCHSVDGEIIRLRNRRQMNVLVQELESLGAYDGQMIHIGGRRRSNAWNFDINPNENLYPFWHDQEPDGASRNENCVILQRRSGNFRQVDVPCSLKARYLCQRLL